MELRGETALHPRHFFMAGLVGLAAVCAMPSQALAGPFDGLSGTWAGSGTVAYADGSSEAIRCRAHYVSGAGGDTLRQDLNCASPSYNMHITADLQHSGGALSGVWSEQTTNSSGQVTGQASDGRIQGSVRGSGFTANVSITTDGNHQSVSIQPSTQRVHQISIELQKS